MKLHLMNKKNMAKSCRVSATAFDKWGVIPVERKGREAFYDVASVIDNRVNNAISQITNETGEIDDDELLRVRIRLLTAQAEAQELKNERERGDVIDTAFCIYVLSKLADFFNHGQPAACHDKEVSRHEAVYAGWTEKRSYQSL